MSRQSAKVDPVDSHRRDDKDGGTSIVQTVNLFQKGSLDSLIATLETYRDQIPERLRVIVSRLAESGLRVAEKSMSNAQGDYDKRVYEFLIDDGTTAGASITARFTFKGEDVVFWEFGAGIYYNEGKENPKASEFGMGVGTYPGQTHAFQKGWFYYDDSGAIHYSHGTEAAMPMYNASLEMMKTVDRIVRSAFYW